MRLVYLKQPSLLKQLPSRNNLDIFIYLNKPYVVVHKYIVFSSQQRPPSWPKAGESHIGENKASCITPASERGIFSTTAVIDGLQRTQSCFS